VPGAGRLRRVSLDFVVVQFNGEGTAVQRYAAAKESPGGDARWMQEIGFVEHHHNGRLILRGVFGGHYVDVEESDHVSQKGAAEGAVAGGVVGALLGPPGIALGVVVGGIVGSQVGTPSDVEDEPGALVDQLRVAVPRSASAVVLIAAAPDADEMLAVLGEGAQGVVRETLTTDQQAKLEASLGSAPPVE